MSERILITDLWYQMRKFSSNTSFHVLNNQEMLGPVVDRKVILVHQKVITYNMKELFCTPYTASLIFVVENVLELREACPHQNG